MKNVEIKKNAVKKLSMATLITSSLLLGGCGNDKAEKPKEEPTKEVVPNEDDKIKFEEMTKEETKDLTEGQKIDKVDEKTLMVPNREALEEKGLDYEIILGTVSVEKDGTEKDTGLNYYVYNQSYINLENRQFEDENNEIKTVRDYMVGVNIVPIVAAYQDEANSYLYKSVQMTDHVYAAELINGNNLEMLQQMISKKYGYIEKTYEKKISIENNVI